MHSNFEIKTVQARPAISAYADVSNDSTLLKRDSNKGVFL